MGEDVDAVCYSTLEHARFIAFDLLTAVDDIIVAFWVMMVIKA
jgi:hypothetical protein